MAKPDATPEATTTTINTLTIGLIIAGIIVVVIGVTSLVLLNRSHTRQAVEAAQKVSDKAIVAIQHRDGGAAVEIGTGEFKAKYTASELTKQFKAIEVATAKPPTLVQHANSNVKGTQTVNFIYVYTHLKVPYYVRTTIVHENDQWKLANISGNLNKDQLL